MNRLILIVLMSGSTVSFLFGQNSNADTFDFISPDRVNIVLQGTTDTLDAHSIAVQDLMTRISPQDSTWVSAANDGGGVEQIVLHYDNSYISIYDNDSWSNFRLKDSTNFQLVFFGSLSLKVGDEFQRARDIFAEAATREISDSPHGANGLNVPYFIKKADGKYYLTDSALYINYDILTGKITEIISTLFR